MPPLTSKGREIEGNMKRQYGEKEGERVFYASRNAGKISGVDGNLGARGKGSIKGTDTFKIAGQPGQDIHSDSFVPGGRIRR